jgi:hypothetical protein
VCVVEGCGPAARVNKAPSTKLRSCSTFVSEKMRERLRGEAAGRTVRAPIACRLNGPLKVRGWQNPAEADDACVRRRRQGATRYRSPGMADPDNKPLHIQTYGVASLRKLIDGELDNHIPGKSPGGYVLCVAASNR